MKDAAMKETEQPGGRIRAARTRLQRAGEELIAVALACGWPTEYLASQFMLVAASSPGLLPGGEMHDSTCEYACAFQDYHLLLLREEVRRERC